MRRRRQASSPSPDRELTRMSNRLSLHEGHQHSVQMTCQHSQSVQRHQLSPLPTLFPQPMSRHLSLHDVRSRRNSLCVAPKTRIHFPWFFNGGGKPKPLVSTKVGLARAGFVAATTAPPTVCARDCGKSVKAWTRPCC